MKAPSDRLTPFDIPLIGKFRNDIDPMYFEIGDFQELINLRYTDKTPIGISGMSKVNETGYTSITGGFQFTKTGPNESHIFLQTSNEANYDLLKSDNSAVVPNIDTYSIFKSFSSNTKCYFSMAPDNSMVVCNGSSNYVWGGNEMRTANFINYDDSGSSFWYDFTDQINNSFSDSLNIATMKRVAGSPTHTYAYIGATRPIQGINIYMGSVVNAGAAGSATVYYWSGSAWVVCSSIVDGTSSGGLTLAKSGKISFQSTVSTAKAKIIRENMAYWYKLDFTNVDNNVTITQCTLDAPVQSIVDIWDGISRPIYSCFRWNTKYADFLLGSSGTNPYVSGDTTTYADWGGMVANTWPFYVGFSERMTGIIITLPDDLYVNTTASTTLTVSYWNGTAWTAVSGLSDGTSSSGISFNQSGTISWDSPAASSEFKTTVANENEFYYYRFMWDKTTYDHIRVSSVKGIPSQNNINAFKFSLFWQNRLFLCNDQNLYKNMIWCSTYNTLQAFNGSDSVKKYIGGNEPLVAGSTLFTRYGGSLYDNAILFKKSEVHLVDGTDSSNWKVYQVSDEVGCIAPGTLRKCNTSYEITQGITKHVLIWMSQRGIEIFDGNTVATISVDINNYFDSSKSDYINLSMADSFSSYYDNVRFEYHVMFATGSSTTLNKEMVYDLRRKKWYEVERGTGKHLTCGFRVIDTAGMEYIYAGTEDGYLECLESGTTFDGNSISYSLQTGDVALNKSLNYVTSIRNLKIISKTISTSTAQVYITHYSDSETTGLDITPFSQQMTDKRIYSIKRSLGSNASVFHSIKLEVVTNNETIGFSPLYIGGFIQTIREDT